MNHVHVGLLEFLQFCAMAILFNFFARQLAARYADRPIGSALAYVAV